MKALVNYIFLTYFVLAILHFLWINKLEKKMGRIEKRLEKLEKEKK